MGSNLTEVFKYHAPTPEQIALYQNVRAAALVLAMAIEDNCPPCADRSAAIRKVREAVHVANASIALGGLV
jgi:hypothetical protein